MNNPKKNCQLCPRLAMFRRNNQKSYPEFFNDVVPSFGELSSEILIIGLAPGLKGANQTGRPFTGDYAGDVLYESLQKHGLATGVYAKHAGDGFKLCNVRITNAVRCVPPENKPISDEVNQCNQFLLQEIESMENLKLILTLGGISHKATIKALLFRQKDYAFGHGAKHNINFSNKNLILLNSYHCSRYNINTKRLTQNMFDDIIKTAKNIV